MTKALHKHTLDTSVISEKNQEQLGKLLVFRDKNARYRKNYLDWDNIERANPPKHAKEKTKYLSKDAENILALVIQKLEKGERVFLNHKYLSTITKCERRQNQRILQQLSEILDITYHNSVTYKGKKYRYSYEFCHKLQRQDNTEVSEDSIGTFLTRQDDPLYIDKNKDIEYIDLKSNFSKNSEEESQENQVNVETKAKVFHFYQYQKPKSLNDHYPLTQEDCNKLQSLSGREFSLNATNEILLDMARKPKLQGHLFSSKARFIGYMAKVLRCEKRDAVKTSNTTFKITARATEAEIIAYTTLAQREEFIATIEQNAIDSPTPENRFKTKLACTLPPMLGYNLLSNLRLILQKGNVLELVMTKIVEITEFSKGIIISQAQAVGGYGDIEKLEVVTKPEHSYD